MNGKEQARKKWDQSREYSDNVGQALDRSAYELQLLANFYHQHGYLERAQEIYRTVLNIRQDINKNKQENAQEEGE